MLGQICMHRRQVKQYQIAGSCSSSSSMPKFAIRTIFCGRSLSGGDIDGTFEITRATCPAAINVCFGTLFDQLSMAGIGLHCRIRTFVFQYLRHGSRPHTIKNIRFILISSPQVRTVVTFTLWVAVLCLKGEALHLGMTDVKIKMLMISNSSFEVAPFLCTTLWHRMSTP